GQLGYGSLKLNNLLKNGLSFNSDVHRAGTGLIGIQRILSLLQVLADFWQLIGQELQALLGLGGFSFNILAYIKTADLVQHRHGISRLGMLQRNGHDAGILALLTGAYFTLETEYGA